MDFVAYLAFKKTRAKDLRRIATKTQGELTVEDLESEAWLAAERHSAKHGCAIDCSNPKDQKLILGTLTVQHVWRKNTERKRKASADQEREDHEGNITTLIELLPTEETADPLELLERREEEERERARKEKKPS